MISDFFVLLVALWALFIAFFGLAGMLLFLLDRRAQREKSVTNKQPVKVKVKLHK